jgi:hypothetical protein
MLEADTGESLLGLDDPRAMQSFCTRIASAETL